MKIINNEKQSAYQLLSDTEIEVERTNLFFNEYGEQSLPVDLPDTEINRKLLNYPICLGQKDKPSSNIPCTIHDGNYIIPCTQAVLGAQKNKKISVSFYMNDGSFLSKMKNKSLMEIFEGEVIDGVSTVQEGIEFCKELMKGENEEFGIFPVIIEIDGGKRYVNQIEYDGQKYNFVNEKDRTEIVNGKTISLSPGFYMSPFIRAPYLLRRIFKHYGYTLLRSKLLDEKPFSDIVFVNNTMDSLVNGYIKLSHLVPDCMCSDVLDVYRKKFCCEFIPNEREGTVQIVLMNDILSSAPSTELSPYIIEEPEITFAEYKQIRLTSSEILSNSGDIYDSTTDIESKYPEVYYSATLGGYYHDGFSTTGPTPVKICGENIPYRDSGTLEDYEVTVPDVMYCLDGFKETESNQPVENKNNRTYTCPYIGSGRSLNSILVGSVQDTSSENNTTSINVNHEQKPILSYFEPISMSVTGYPLGPYGTLSDENGKRSSSLYYNGPRGIFERFYRKFDTVLRNSMHEIQANMLLSDTIKQELAVYEKYNIRGVSCLFNQFCYTLGANKPILSTLYTILPYEPVIEAISEESRMDKNRTGYKWNLIQGEDIEISEKEYNETGNPPYEVNKRYSSKLDVIYPLPPTKEMYEKGGIYYSRMVYGYTTHRDSGGH